MLYDIKINIPLSLKKIINILQNSGFEAFIVGGCVRDCLLGYEPKDWDIATNATPLKVKGIFQNNKDFSIKDFGISFGTLGLYCIDSKINFEITTYRAEGTYSDFRHPCDITFVDNIYEDLKRRDFSINALAYNITDSKIYDYFNAFQDLRDKRLVCVGNADKRFNEDALRIMRCIRFCATLGFDIESKSKKAVFKHFHLLKYISKERINAEITKMLLGDYVDKAIIEYKEILIFVFESLKYCDLESNALALKNAPKDIDVRLAILLYPLKNVKQSLESLKFSRKIINNTQQILNIESKLPTNKIELKMLLLKYEKYPNIILKWLQLKNALESNNAAINLYNQIMNECFYISKLAINGNDIKQILNNYNIKNNGKLIGEILQMLILNVINEKCSNNIESLRQKVIEFLES